MAKIVILGSFIGRAACVHPDRDAQIKEIQSTPGVLWRAKAHARFQDQAPGASKTLNGVKGDWKEAIEEAAARGEIVRALFSSDTDVPDDFDSATNWPQCAKIISDIRDQSNCGCCWAFAGAEAASARMCIASNASIQVPLSAQDVCFNAESDGCKGGMIDTPWNFINHQGAVSGGQYGGTGPFGAGLCSSYSLPHCHHHGPQGDDPYPSEGAAGCESQTSPKGPTTCDSNATAPHADFANDKYAFSGSYTFAAGEQDIQKAIMAGGPMETAFTVYSDFENYDSGIYHHVTGSQAGGHAVMFVGWGVESGVKYWKVANSWNPYWGENGYFRIRRGNNEGFIENSAVGSMPSATWSKAPARAVLV